MEKPVKTEVVFTLNNIPRGSVNFNVRCVRWFSDHSRYANTELHMEQSDGKDRMEHERWIPLDPSNNEALIHEMARTISDQIQERAELIQKKG